MNEDGVSIDLTWIQEYQQLIARCILLAYLIKVLPTFIPYWDLSLTKVSLDPHDLQLLRYLEEYHQHPNGSKEQNHFFSRIMAILLPTILLRVGDSPRVQKALGEALSKTYDWLCREILVLTPALLSTCEEYCQNNDSERSKKLRKHLDIIQEYDPDNVNPASSKKYRKAQNDLRKNIENILEEKSEEDKHAKALFNPVIRKGEPRLKYFTCHSPDRIAERLAKWITSHLKYRIWEVSPPQTNLSLNVPLGDNAGSTTPVDHVTEESRQEAPKIEELFQTDFMLGALAEREEACTLTNALTSSSSNEILDHLHVNGYSNCKRRILAQRLLLKNPPDNLEEIAEEYKIPFKAFYQALPTFFEVIENLYIELGIESQLPWSTDPFLRGDLIRGYILADPDGWLVHPINQDRPNLTWQTVAQRLCLQEAKTTVVEIAREFDVPVSQLYQPINGAGQRPGLLDRLAGSLIEYYPQPARLRQVIAQDTQHLLRNCHVRNHPLCNAQFLAQRRLRILGSVQSFEDIVKELDQQGSRLKPKRIEDHWYEKCLHCIGRVIRKLDNSSRGGES